MSSLTNGQDIKDTKKLFEQAPGGITIPEAKTPWYFLSTEFESGYRHWIMLNNGNKMPIPCKGGKEGKGFAVDKCEFCAKTLELYRKGQAYQQKGLTEKATAMKDAGNSIRATFSAVFKVVKGAGT